MVRRLAVRRARARRPRGGPGRRSRIRAWSRGRQHAGSRSPTTNGRSLRSTSTSARRSPGTGSGPDLAHSVTGISANDKGWDSDPTTDACRGTRSATPITLAVRPPRAPISSSASCTPSSPARWSSPRPPAIPVTEPDPVPEINFDLKAPIVGSLRLDSNIFGRGGTGMHFALDERTVVDAEYYRLDERWQAPLRRLGAVGRPCRLQRRPLRRAAQALPRPPRPLRRRHPGH